MDSATKAATAIFHSKAIDRYSTITIRNVIRASTALVVIWPPQLAPTNEVLMSLAPSWLVSAFSTVKVCWLVSDVGLHLPGLVAELAGQLLDDRTVDARRG